VPRDQTRGNDNKDAMLDCKSGFHQNEDKRNCHIYMTSIMIITFIMFLLEQRTLSNVVFLFVPLVLSLLCVYYIRMLCRNVCVVSNNVVSDECDVLDKAALCIQQKCDESALCIQQNDVGKEIKYAEQFRSRLASCADALWARRAIFLPHAKERLRRRLLVGRSLLTSLFTFFLISIRLSSEKASC